jgi:hypothetical protein
MIPLEWPVDFDGKLWTEIEIRRVSGKEVRVYLDALRTSEGDILPPMIDCPIEVWNALDADDQQTIDEAAQGFTPKRLQAPHQAAVALDAAKPEVDMSLADAALQKAGSIGSDIVNALSVSARPHVDTATLERALSLANQLKAALAGVGPAVQAAHNSVSRSMNRNFADHGVTP